MRTYNLTLVFKPNGNRDEVLKEISDTLTETGGSILNQEELSLKKLAYPIKKSLDGYFYQVTVTAGPTWPTTITDLLRVSDHLLRFIIVSGAPSAVKEVSKEPSPASTNVKTSVDKQAAEG